MVNVLVISLAITLLHNFLISILRNDTTYKIPTTIPIERVVVEREVVEEEETVIEDVKINLDIKALVKALLNDPKCREEVYTAVREGAGSATAPVGSSENHTLYVESKKDRPPGADNYITRTNGGRLVSLMLRVENKVSQVKPGEEDLQNAIKNNPAAAKEILRHLGFK